MNEQTMTVIEAWKCGGPLMWVLAGISVLVFAVMMYLLFAQRERALAPGELVSDIFNRFQKKDATEARRLAERQPCAFSQLVLAALDAQRPGAKEGAVRQAIETTGGHIAERLQGVVDWLADLAAIAPLVGLLGTVLGMYQAFGGIASDLAANARPVVLAQGVSQAIVTTVFGLAVAIPALAAHAYFRRRMARRVALLESLAVELESVSA